MRRILLVLVVVALTAAMVAVNASSAFAEPPPKYNCPPGSHGIQVLTPKGEIVGHCT